MNKRIGLYFNHAEPRVQYCIANADLWGDKEDKYLADLSRKTVYHWIGLAQDHHQEDHF